MVRAGVLGGSAVALAAGAHTLGGGQLPSPAVLIPTVGLVGLVATVLTARRMRFGPLLGLLAVEQVLLHLGFGLGTAGPMAPGAGTGGSVVTLMAGHHDLGSLAATVGADTADPTVAGTAMGALSALVMPGSAMNGPTMLIAHLVATVLTALVIARGEAWLWSVVSRLIRRAGKPVVLARRVARACTATEVRGIDQWVRRCTPARGPPRWAA